MVKSLQFDNASSQSETLFAKINTFVFFCNIDIRMTFLSTQDNVTNSDNVK